MIEKPFNSSRGPRPVENILKHPAPTSQGRPGNVTGPQQPNVLVGQNRKQNNNNFFFQ